MHHLFHSPQWCAQRLTLPLLKNPREIDSDTFKRLTLRLVNAQRPGQDEGNLSGDGSSLSRVSKIVDLTYLTSGCFDFPLSVVNFEHLRDTKHGAPILKFHQGPNTLVSYDFIWNFRCTNIPSHAPVTILAPVARCNLSSTVHGFSGGRESDDTPYGTIDQISSLLVLSHKHQ